MQPTRRSVVDVESGLLSMPTALMHAVNSVSITGAKRGRNVVSQTFLSHCLSTLILLCTSVSLV